MRLISITTFYWFHEEELQTELLTGTRPLPIDFAPIGGYAFDQREGRIQSAERAVPTSNSTRQYESSFSLTRADSRQL
jgi:hypothetical protein